MKKSDLKTGMIVKYRSGNYRTVFKDTAFDCDFLAGGGTFNDLCHYDDNLLNDKQRSLDIMEIYSPSSKVDIMRCHNLGKTIWTRHEAKKLTVSEIEAILGYPVEIIADR